MRTLTLLLLALPSLPQDVELIRRNERIAYEEAIDLCRKAEARIGTEPAQAVDLLTDLLEKRPLRKMECTVRIEVFADAPGPPVALLPYQLRGRARQSLARTAPERRKLLDQALEDFETSTARGIAASADLARGVRRELLALLQPLHAGTRPEAPPIGLNALLLRMEADRQGDEVAACAEWFRTEAAATGRRLEDLGRGAGSVVERQSAAARELRWCDAATAALTGTKAGAKALADLTVLRARAATLAAYRGSIRLKISASPYAEIVVLRRDGKDVPLGERLTPVVLSEPVEIGDLDVELRHPAAGRRSASFPAGSLKDGATYVLSADMEKGALTLTPLPH